MRHLLIQAGAMIGLVTGCTTYPNLTADLAITDVTVIDPETTETLPRRTIVIDGGRIIKIARRGSLKLNVMQVIDGSGRYLIPGLMDMHVHTNVSFIVDDSLKLMLANGVTGVRDMAGDCWEPRGEIFLCIDDMRRIAAAIEDGDKPGARLLRLSSAYVQSEPTAPLPKNHNPLYTPLTRADGVALAQYLDERGVDIIKLYHAIRPDAYEGLMTEAIARGLEVSGHVPNLVTAQQASDDGLRTIEHANTIVTDCGGYAAEYREAMSAVIRREDGAEWPSDFSRLKESVDTFTPSICENLMKTLTKNGTYYVPTHGTREMDALAGDPAYRDDPRLGYLPPPQLAQWRADLDRTAAVSPEMTDLYRQFYDLGLKVTKLASEAGVSIMLGTDANDTMIIPGFAVHDELARLVEAGLSPMEALRAATTAPAAYLDRESDFGGVAPGKIADLILLDENPLQNIANTRTIQAVVLGGRVIDREALDELLAEVRSHAGG